MSVKHYMLLTVFFTFSSLTTPMERPPDQRVHDHIRAGTALVMAWAGLNYLRTVYHQQMYPQQHTLRGWRNPAFRFLSTFFGSAITQQVNSNIVANPEVRRLFWRTTLRSDEASRSSLTNNQQDNNTVYSKD